MKADKRRACRRRAALDGEIGNVDRGCECHDENDIADALFHTSLLLWIFHTVCDWCHTAMTFLNAVIRRRHCRTFFQLFRARHVTVDRLIHPQFDQARECEEFLASCKVVQAEGIAVFHHQARLRREAKYFVGLQ